MNRKFLFFWCLFILINLSSVVAQDREITGKVIDASSGETLPGVSIQVKGTTIGTTTDQDGNYLISATPQDVLVFSYIGYTTKEVSVDDRTTIDVILYEDIRLLDEVVVVGYGVALKSDLTGAISTIEPELLERTASMDVIQSIQGAVPGVHVTAQSGEPGESMRVRIRGTTTIHQSDPIYVVDGIPTDDISYLQPYEIASMEVLKDASATAIYGSRGANGVVLITTKSGLREEKEATIEFNSYTATQETIRTLDMCNATEYATLKLQSFINDGVDVENADPSMGLYRDIQKLKYIIDNDFIGTDWQSEILRPAAMQNYNLSISGGGKEYSYFISGGYLDQQGIVKNSELRRINFRSRGEYDVKSWMTAGISFAYVNTERTYIDRDLYTGVLTTALRIDPITPAWDSSKNNWGSDQFSQVNNNPARRVDEAKHDRSSANNIITNMWLQLRLFEGLNFRSQFGYNRVNYSRETYLPEFFITTREYRNPSELHDELIPTENFVLSNYFDYNNEFGNHRLNTMIGTELQNMKSSHVKMGAFNVPEASASRYFSSARNIDDFSLITDIDHLWEQRILSFFGRINYVYNNRYMFTGTLRYDGSSKFAESNRWGVFPSFSLGWNMKEEGFLVDVDIVTDMKLRLGWGEVGNEGSVRNYQYLSTMDPGQIYVFGDQLIEGRMTTTMDNPELTWEVSQMTNIGIDASFFNGRLDITADYFYRVTKGILVRTPVPSYFGSGAPYDNAADMRNSGVEFALNHRNRVTDRFGYNVGFNITHINNKVLDLGGADVIMAARVGKIEYFTTRTEVGEEFAYFYGFRTDGIFKTQEELDAHVNDNGQPLQPNAQVGDVRFLDINGDGVIDGNDREKLGSGNPDFVFGFNMGFYYGSFDFNMLIHGVYGVEAINALRANIASSDGIENSLAERLDSWTPDNQNTDQYRMTYNDPNDNIMMFSDLWVEDASFLRLQNIQIGYNLPKKSIDRLGVGLHKFRVYIAADNLFTLTNYSGWDPEIGELYANPLKNGVDMGRYPTSRIYRIGVNIVL